MKKYLSFASLLLLSACVSGVGQDERNADIFSEARRLAYNLYQEGNYENLDGKIQDLINFINSQGTSEVSPTPDPFEIEGIVTVPSNVGFAIASSSNLCNSYQVYARSFVLQDQNAGILVAYGLEPPSTSAPTDSMRHILNARTPNMAVFGDHIKLRVKKVQKYGNSNTIPLVTDFEMPQVISSRNTVRFTVPSTAFSRANDLFRVRRITGFVTTSPSYVECPSNSQREFQYEHQTGYSGVLCVGATSAADAANCTGGGKIAFNFKMSYNLGAGTLSGFDVDNMFSYTLAKGAYVRLTGPVIIARYDGTDSQLTLLLDQKHQIETLKAP